MEKSELEWREAQIVFCNLNAEYEQVSRQKSDFIRQCQLHWELAEAEKRLEELFFAGSKDRLMGRAYAEYRKRLLFHHRKQS
jgi:hypothetical protein